MASNGLGYPIFGLSLRIRARHVACVSRPDSFVWLGGAGFAGRAWPAGQPRFDLRSWPADGASADLDGLGERTLAHFPVKCGPRESGSLFDLLVATGQMKPPRHKAHDDRDWRVLEVVTALVRGGYSERGGESDRCQSWHPPGHGFPKDAAVSRTGLCESLTRFSHTGHWT